MILQVLSRLVQHVPSLHALASVVRRINRRASLSLNVVEMLCPKTWADVTTPTPDAFWDFEVHLTINTTQ
jgi:hypothetical protein